MLHGGTDMQTALLQLHKKPVPIWCGGDNNCGIADPESTSNELRKGLNQGLIITIERHFVLSTHFCWRTEWHCYQAAPLPSSIRSLIGHSLNALLAVWASERLRSDGCRISAPRISLSQR